MACYQQSLIVLCVCVCVGVEGGGCRGNHYCHTFTTAKSTIAILLLLPLYYHNTTIVKVTLPLLPRFLSLELLKLLQ